MNKSHGLDALRGALALIVFVAHGRQIFIRPLAPDGATHLVMALMARGAVLAFFCLSGFVIASSLAANLRRNGRLDAMQYAKARVRRIVPPLLTVIALTFALQIALVLLGADGVPVARAARTAFSSNFSEQLLALVSLTMAGDLTGLGLNGPLWSLAYEIQLYVVAGLCACIAWARSYWKALAAAVLLLYVFHISVWVALDLQALCFVAFGTGSAAYFLRGTSRRMVTWSLIASLAIAVGLALDARSLIDLDRSMLPSQAAFSVSMACLVLLLSNRRGNPFLVNAGGYSYTLYIGHFPLLLFMYFLAYHLAPASLTAQWAWLTAAVALAVTWLALAALGRWVERPDLFRRRTALAPLPAQ